MINSNSFVIVNDDDGDVQVDVLLMDHDKGTSDNIEAHISPEMALSIAIKLIEVARIGLANKKHAD